MKTKSQPENQLRRMRIQRNAAASFLGFLAVLWLVENFIAEADWFSSVLAYAPQQWILAPLFLLFYGAIRSRSRRALVVNCASLAFWFFGFLGFNIPWRLAPRAPFAASSPLRILTYNIALEKSNVENLAAAIKRQNAGVICLQEAGSMRDARAIERLIARFPGWNFRREGELLTLSRYPIVASHAHRVGKNNATGILQTSILIGKTRIEIFNLHLMMPLPKIGSPRVSYRYTAPARASQLRLLLQITEGIRSPLAVMGDFNTPPRGTIYRTLRSRWTDTFRAVSWGGGNTFPSGSGLIRIDYIWTNTDLEARRCFVPNERASDHYPLVADFDVKSTP